MTESASTMTDETNKQVLISGVGSDCDENSLRLLFCDKRLSGGGPIETILLDRSAKSALIIFQSTSGD